MRLISCVVKLKRYSSLNYHLQFPVLDELGDVAAQDLHRVLVEQEEAVVEWNLPLQEHLGAWGCVQARTGNYTGNCE